MRDRIAFVLWNGETTLRGKAWSLVLTLPVLAVWAFLVTVLIGGGLLAFITSPPLVVGVGACALVLVWRARDLR